MGYSYFLFGISIRSQIALPELTEDGCSADSAVQIRMGAVPNDVPNVRFRDPLIQIGTDDTIVSIGEVARYWIHAGREITIEAAPRATDLSVRLYLLGSVLGVLCHERGLLPLHANAVEINGRAVAFAGHSGAGKSTLAAALEDRGYAVLTDDICVLSVLEEGHPLAWPGMPHLRLRRDTAEVLGREVDGNQRTPGPQSKYQIPVLARIVPCRSVPVAKIYVLSEPSEPAAIFRLSTSQALGALLTHTYRQQYLRISGAERSQFSRNTRLLRRVPIYSLPWPKDFANFAARVTVLERHLQAGIPSYGDAA